MNAAEQRLEEIIDRDYWAVADEVVRRGDEEIVAQERFLTEALEIF